MSTHSAWKAWQQRGRRRNRSSGSNFDKQTAQSAEEMEAEEERRVMEEKVKRGSESTYEFLRFCGETRFRVERN